MINKDLVHLLGNFIGQLPDVEKGLKTLLISYLTTYQQLIVEQKNTIRLNKELADAYSYIDKLEKENEEVVN